MTERDPDKAADDATAAAAEARLSRRRLLATLGVGIAGAYVAPTLFSLGHAHADHDTYGRRRYGSDGSRPSYSRPSYSRPSYSRPSYSRPSISRPSNARRHPLDGYRDERRRFDARPRYDERRRYDDSRDVYQRTWYRWPSRW